MSIEQLCINTIRFLSVDGVQKANSGHPGMPMGAADYAFVLWTKFLRFNPKDPAWINRDRFVLSAGHGSMLLYSLLHLMGFDLDMDELKQFRQLGSKTPGHPEYKLAPGVETTTGPLGQGFGNGVGLALASKMMAARFNAGNDFPISYRVFGIVSDGDLMEGVSSEAASLAGHLGLGNLNYIYDDNRITIDGSTKLTFSEDVAKRFNGYHWHVQSVNAYDRKAIEEKLQEAIAETGRPSLIIAHSHIGYGSPNKQDSEESHGAPLGDEEVKLAKENLGWPSDRHFHIPDETRQYLDQIISEKKSEYDDWQKEFSNWKKNYSDKFDIWKRHFETEYPDDLPAQLLQAAGDSPGATRSHSANIIQRAAELVPALSGGSADLAASVKTNIRNSSDIGSGSFHGQNLHFGVREHGMASICNGLALSGAFIPFASTFLIFSDYMRPSIRLSALMGVRVIYVFSHDSVFLGEDGPTHQPIEHVASLRLIPNMVLLRPADAPETALSWAYAIQRKEGPTAIILTRQNLNALEYDNPISQDAFEKGGYILQEGGQKEAQMVLIATGSEVSLASDVRNELESRGVSTRVVSVPSVNLLQAQSDEYRLSLFGRQTRKVVIEAGQVMGWQALVGRDALLVGIDRFGESAPYKDLARHFGFTVDGVIKRIEEKGWLD